MLKLYSIFKSLQGESSRLGYPCVFVRLAGCPHKCKYCDTRDACEAEGESISIEEVTRRILAFGPKMVEVTGGEPLIQDDTPALLEVLLNQGLEVLLETSGAHPIEKVDPRIRIVMDVKCPDSGGNHLILMNNFARLNPSHHELKFVVSSKTDFDWAIEFIRENGLEKFELLFSPVSGIVRMDALADWILSADIHCRLQPQLHKLIWPDATREV